MKADNKYLIHVRGITCSMCIQKLENLSNYDDKVKSAHVYFGQSLVEIQTHQQTTPNEVVDYIKKLGFKAEFLEDKAEIFEANKRSNREHLSKLGVAGFCAGNIMLATVPLYSGVETEYKHYFSYLAFALFLPIMIYSAQDFYKNAWRSFKAKSLSIDLPITVALITGFAFSTWNLFKAEYDHLYYDSTASFIFLILSARYLLNKLQQNFIATYSDTDFGLNHPYQLTHYEGSKKKEFLLVGDQLTLTKGQALPVKSKISSDFSEWNLSLISGETYPKDYQKNMIIQSGAILISGKCSVEVLETYKNSRICNFQKKLEDIKKTKSEFVHFTDRFSHYFILSVFTVAIVFGIYFAQVDSFQAFQRSLALLIVACPCALALGTPLAYLLGVYRANQAGILVYKKDIFDRLLQVKNIFFDKTGTLTHGQISVQRTVPYDPHLINIVLNMELVSQHPIAFALRKKYINYYSDLKISAYEIPGIGIQAQWNDDTYRFLKNVDSERMSSVLYKNNEPVLAVYFEDSVRMDSKSEISRLASKDKNIFLLTGDTSLVAQEVAGECGIENVFYDQTPDMKKDWVRKYHPALMVGDGLNDVLALQSAHIGISVQGSVQMSADSSDAYLLKSGISQISFLFNLSERVRSTIYTNLGISLFYNFVAGYFALTGAINPLIAAILMPISSVVILLNTLRGVR
ncbi:MAG: cation-translocating P-type ATPase [Bdellovibrionota bacterium]